MIYLIERRFINILLMLLYYTPAKTNIISSYMWSDQMTTNRYVLYKHSNSSSNENYSWLFMNEEGEVLDITETDIIKVPPHLH